jgi:TrmH family RNA methyltransferase
MLTSVKNPLVKQLKQLHRAKGRHDQQQMLLEGTHLIEEACGANLGLITLCYTADWLQRYPDLGQQAIARAQRQELVSPDVLAAMTTTITPDGVVATAERTPLTRTLPHPTRLGLALERIQDPGNLGTIIRTAAAAGVDSLWVSADSVDLDHPKVLRASAGQWFRLPMGVVTDLPAQVAQWRSLPQHQVIATLPTAPQMHWDIDFTRPTLLLLGNEGAGLSSELAAMADGAVTIPLAAGVESLNVAIAAAVIVYEAQRQRSRQASGSSG